MKKFFLFFLSVTLSLSVLAQGNSGGKGKDKQKEKVKSSKTDNPGYSEEKDDKIKKEKNDKLKKEKDDKIKKAKEDKVKNDDHDRKVWDGIGDDGCSKPSKNQPAKVRAAFQRDYPNATDVRWTKCRGDWTATFNGNRFRSTAVYHANGERKDTRTPVGRDNIPRPVLDGIFKRSPGSRVDDVIRIERPNIQNEIFRVKNVVDGRTQYDFFDSNGTPVTYNY